jgi:hypothetical protein
MEKICKKRGERGKTSEEREINIYKYINQIKYTKTWKILL